MFRTAQVDGKARLTSIRVERKSGAGKADFPMAKGLQISRGLAARLYPRWDDKKMKLVSQRAMPYGPPDPRTKKPVLHYAFSWVEWLTPQYTTQNHVNIVLNASTARVSEYSASFAAMPLRYPSIPYEAAKGVAQADLHTTVKPSQFTRVQLNESYCLLGGPTQDPVWFFHFEKTLIRADGGEPIRVPLWIAVNARTGVVDKSRSG